MKILANREALLAAFQAVWGVVPSKSPKAILQNVKIVASADEGTTLTGTDLEVGLIRRVAGVKVDEPGAAILSPRVLEILKSSRDEELLIETTEAGLLVRGLHAEFKLSGDDPDLFPTVAEFDASDYYKVASGDLKRAIRRTIFAIDEESTRYALGGLLWEIQGGKLTIVATDGRRLAETILAIENEGNPPELVHLSQVSPPAPILPGKAMKLLERSLADDDTPVHISINPKSHALIWADDLTLYTRLVEGRFPQYESVFPGDALQKLTVDVCGFLNGISQARIVTSEESRGVDFIFSPDNLTLSAQASDRGAATIDLPFSLGGEPLTITFDPQYLEGMLRVLDGDQEITLNLIDAKNPVVITVDDNYKYVIMPLTRDR